MQTPPSRLPRECGGGQPAQPMRQVAGSDKYAKGMSKNVSEGMVLQSCTAPPKVSFPGLPHTHVAVAQQRPSASQPQPPSAIQPHAGSSPVGTPRSVTEQPQAAEQSAMLARALQMLTSLPNEQQQALYRMHMAAQQHPQNPTTVQAPPIQGSSSDSRGAVSDVAKGPGGAQPHRPAECMHDMRVRGGGQVQWGVSSQARTGCNQSCLLYTSPSPRDRTRSRMPSSA